MHSHPYRLEPGRSLAGSNRTTGNRCNLKTSGSNTAWAPALNYRSRSSQSNPPCYTERQNSSTKSHWTVSGRGWCLILLTLVLKSPELSRLLSRCSSYVKWWVCPIPKYPWSWHWWLDRLRIRWVSWGSFYSTKMTYPFYKFQRQILWLLSPARN